MEQRKINQLNAGITTVKYCEDTAADTAAITNFAPTVAVAKSKIAIIQGYNILGDTPTKGVTLNVNGIRQAMSEKTYLLSNAIMAYGASQNPVDNNLIQQAKLSIGGLETLSKEKCGTECDRIRQLASTVAAGIAPFGASATDITDAQTLITLFLTGINSPRAAVINRKSANQQADLVLDDLMNNIIGRQLDIMANTLRFTKKEWYGKYQFSREVLDLGTTFTKLRATAEDEEGNSITGAVISLIQNDEVKYTKKTDAEGKVSIVKIKPGNYNIRVEKKNFLTQTEVDAHFAPGAEKNHPFVLKSNTAPPGFKIEEFNVPGNGSLIFPFKLPNPIPVGIEIYIVAKNGNAVLCTTDLPASPCMGGYNLNMGVVYQGSITGLGLDFSKQNLQLTNLSPDTLTVAAGTNAG